MKTLVMCRPASGVSREAIAARAADEMESLRRLRDGGLLLEAYSPGGPGAVLILDGTGDQVETALGALPLVRERLIETERIELHPFPGLAPAEQEP